VAALHRTLLVAIACVLVASRADAALDGGADEIAALEKQLKEEHTALQTQDCSNACRALASIRRAADRICALEPGPRCADARAKADDAQRRVSEACPDCSLAFTPPKEDDGRAVTQAAPPEPLRDAPASEARGGCRNCSTLPGRGAPSGDAGTILLLMAWAAARLLRKKSSERG
jgi:hypothetical protein